MQNPGHLTNEYFTLVTRYEIIQRNKRNLCIDMYGSIPLSISSYKEEKKTLASLEQTKIENKDNHT